MSKPGSKMPGAGPEYGTHMTLSLARNNSACVVCCHYFPQLEGRLVGSVHAKLLPSVRAEVPGTFSLKHAVFNDMLEFFPPE